MTYLPEQRVGIRRDVSDFVVAEDQGLEARLRRAYLAARERARGAVDQARDAVTQIGQGPHDAVVPEEVATPGWKVRVMLLLQEGRSRLSALGLRVGAFSSSALAALRPADRLRDLASLALVCLRLVGRMFWQLPATAKVVVITLSALGLVITWPGEPATDAEVEPPPALRSAATAIPPPAPRFNPELWKPVAAPIPAFHLEAPELDRATMRYRARIHAEGARQEIITWGAQPASETGRRRQPVFGALVVEHYPKSQPEPDTLFIDIVRRAAIAGAGVDRLGEIIGLQTKFGVFETADASLSGEAGNRSCLVYRHLAEAVPMQVHGWLCGTPERPVDRSVLGCVLDRIDLLSAGKDDALRAYFASVERARKPCGTARLITTKASWIDPAGDMPVLKASILPSVAR